MLGNHFTLFFTEFTSEKKFENRSIFGKDIWTKLCGLLFWATLYMWSCYLLCYESSTVCWWV